MSVLPHLDQVQVKGTRAAFLEASVCKVGEAGSPGSALSVYEDGQRRLGGGGSECDTQ